MRNTRRTTRRSLTSLPVALAAVVALAAPALAAQHAPTVRPAKTMTPSYSWAPSATGSTERFRGLAAVNGRVAWLAGTNATVLRTTDGGASWQDVSPPDRQVTGAAGRVQFRDIEAQDAHTAVALAIGEGTDSRVLVTHNGGRTWRVTFVNHTPAAFYDCMSFFDSKHGLAVSDPVNGKFRLISTSDGGESWKVLPRKGMPRALDGEFGFAASGTCLVTSGSSDAWIASGGGAVTRVYHSTDRGRHWTVRSTPVASSATAGIFSLAVRAGHRLVAVGGDFNAPDAAVDSAAWSADAGRTWRLSSDHAWWLSLRRGLGRPHPLDRPRRRTDRQRREPGRRARPGPGSTPRRTTPCSAQRRGACWASGDAGAAAKLVREAVSRPRLNAAAARRRALDRLVQRPEVGALHLHLDDAEPRGGAANCSRSPAADASAGMRHAEPRADGGQVDGMRRTERPLEPRRRRLVALAVGARLQQREDPAAGVVDDHDGEVGPGARSARGRASPCRATAPRHPRGPGSAGRIPAPRPSRSRPCRRCRTDLGWRRTRRPGRLHGCPARSTSRTGFDAASTSPSAGRSRRRHLAAHERTGQDRPTVKHRRRSPGPQRIPPLARPPATHREGPVRRSAAAVRRPSQPPGRHQSALAPGHRGRSAPGRSRRPAGPAAGRPAATAWAGRRQ